MAAETLKEVANRYKVLATLGEGGMGTVYLVEDTTNGQQVALKVLSAKTGNDQNLFLQFKQEFRVMAKLKHPNNCEVYDYGLMPDGAPYFTMEVVPGKGLDELIPLPPDQFTSVLNQLCQALAFIHSQGFVHCDLKPENVRLKPDGTVKLMDFGLMEVAGQSGGAIKGTLAYIAPEVAKRARIDQRSDLYSLGAVAYQLLTGETPFKGASPIEVLRAHLNQQPRPLRELNAAVPTLMEQVVLKMMAKEPVARHQSAYDVLSALGIEVDDSLGASLLSSAFVGRQGAIARLQSALQGVKRDRRGQVLWVVGQPGIGKSRLLGEFRFSVQLEELPFLAGACTVQRAPYGPFVEILRQLLPLAKEACPEALYEHAPLLSKLLPELADGRSAPSREPEQEKILVQAAIANLLLKATAKTGGVIVLEAWDLADQLSNEALTYLLRQAEGHPILFVGAGRDKECVRGEAITLEPLEAGEVTEMITSMLGADVPAGLAQQIFDLTAGNPLFVTNLLEHLLSRSAFTRSKGKWILPAAIAAEDLPSNVKDLLLERFNGLSEPARLLAEFAAVVGTSFALKIARDVLAMADDVLFDAIDELKQAKVLAHDAGSYTVASNDLKEALYGQIAEEERTRLHTAVAEFLETELGGAEPDLNQGTALAQHFLKSRHTDKAIQYALDAGARNREIHAIEQAEPLLEGGLAILDRAGESERWAATRCDYLFHLAAVRIYKSKLDQVSGLLTDGLALAESIGDQLRLLQLLATRVHYCTAAQSSDMLTEGVEIGERAIALADTISNRYWRARVGLNVARSLFFLGQNARAQSLFEETAHFSKTHDLPFFLARSLCFLGYLRATGGADTREQGFVDLAEAVAIQERIADKYGLGYTYMMLVNVQMHAGRFREAEATAINHRKIMAELYVRDDLTIAVLNLSIILAEVGRFDEALRVATESFEMSQATANKMGIPISQSTVAIAALYRGDLKRAVEEIRQAQTSGREANNYVYSCVIPNVVETYLQLGRLQDALGAAQEARDLVSATGNTEIETRLWVYMGEIHGRLGENPAARSYFEKAREHASAGDELHILARAEKGLAWMDICEGHFDAAESHLGVAIQHARQLPMRLLEAECLYLHGQLALGRKLNGEAHSFFAEAVEIARELGAPALEAVALHGLSRVTTKPQEAALVLQDAKRALQTLLEQLSPEEGEAFLSFMERAQLQRDEVGKAGAPRPGAVVEAPPALPEDAPAEERAEWLTAQIAASAQAQAAEAQRLAQIAQEWESLQKTGLGSNARVAELEAQNRRLEQLIKFSMAVSNVQDLNKVLEQAVDLIVEITGAERGFLLFFENGQIKSQVSRVNVDRRSPMDWQFSKSIAEKVLTTGEVVCVFDALSDTQFNQAQSVVDLNLRTVICVPMRTKGKMIGAIYVDRQSINENFTPEDLEMVMGLAAQAAGAIDNARLHQEWVDKSKRLENLNELSKIISGSLEEEEVLDLIIKMTLEVSRAERGFLFLLDDDRRKLICRAARDTRRSLPLDEDHEISQSICTKVLQTGVAENVADAMNDEEFQFQQSIMALNLRMVMCVPIYAKGQVIGLLYVDSQAVVNAFSDKDLDLLNAIAGHASVAIENSKLYARTQKLAGDLRKTFYSFVQALGASIDAKHPLTAGHSFRVTEYSVRLARKIGLPEEEIENIRIAGLLHDVGKIGTPDHILQKPGSFTNEEYEIMKRHVVHTKEILDTIYFPEHQQHIPAMAGAHHEKWDGKGYPNNQKAEEIPFGGRILALGDVFDAITSKRDYREAMPLSQALNIIRQGIGSHFDPDLGPAFIEMIEQEGMVVYESERVAQIPQAEAPQTQEASS